MAKQLARHDIDDSLYIFLQDNSKKWYARFQLFGKWHCKSTKQTDKDEALAAARLLRMEWKIKAETGTLTKSKRFRDVAERCILAMEHELAHGGGKISYKDYIGALRRYHIPFFDRTYITSLDQDKLKEFDIWRIQKAGKVLNKSTLLTHNAALQMVFKEAVARQWMLPVQVPVLSNKGEQGARRAAFSEEEYEKVVETIEIMRDNSRKEKTRQIRELLLDYADVVVHTGIRPGTEMEELTWSDILMSRQGHQVIFKIKVRKGKTTKHTGTRTVVCKDEFVYPLMNLMERFPNRKPSDKIFVLADGTSTNELGKTFVSALEEADLKTSPDGPRTLYSLRHTYITWQLLTRTLRIDVLARQCGTSIAMIEQHYSHVVPSMFEEELSGVTFDKTEKKSSAKSRERKKQIQLKLSGRFNEWEAEAKRRGCI
ncbi:site-specific integrase [Alteromonas sp. NFXS44]|uniref:tyrosine-type recombinase/integrase n=1 Tax=Alteromonas sp. NFXS44 TaxID=2818435 RepID=UPI0032DEC4AB